MPQGHINLLHMLPFPLLCSQLCSDSYRVQMLSRAP